MVAVSGDRKFNPGWHTALDLKHLLTVAKACACSALARKESRGAHSRIDFPNKETGHWAKHTIGLRKGEDGEMEVVETPILEIPEKLQKIIEEQG